MGAVPDPLSALAIPMIFIGTRAMCYPNQDLTGRSFMTHVLIVDDEPLLREEFQEALELEDIEVAAAESVADALSQCATTSFDAVVTDLKMPMVGGLELLRHLNQDGYPGAMFVVSGHGAESSRDEALALGAVACFAKPIDPDELVEAINGAL